MSVCPSVSHPQYCGVILALSGTPTAWDYPELWLRLSSSSSSGGLKVKPEPPLPPQPHLYTAGAPVPDVATQVFSGLDLMLTSLGAEREKRAAGYDKVIRRVVRLPLKSVFHQVFTLEDLGVSIGLSYHDTNRKVRGGKLHVDTPKVKKVSNLRDIREKGFVCRSTLSWILIEIEESLPRKTN